MSSGDRWSSGAVSVVLAARGDTVEAVLNDDGKPRTVGFPVVPLPVAGAPTPYGKAPRAEPSPGTPSRAASPGSTSSVPTAPARSIERAATVG